MSDRPALDGALVAVVSAALHERCLRRWEEGKGAEPTWTPTLHPAQAHDHGALDVVAALRDQGWICHHRKEGIPS